MKKVFFTMALFVMTTMVFATNKVEKNVEKDLNMEAIALVFNDCSDAGNELYFELRANNPDMTHREARTERRAFVRWCRGLE